MAKVSSSLFRCYLFLIAVHVLVVLDVFANGEIPKLESLVRLKNTEITPRTTASLHARGGSPSERVGKNGSLKLPLIN